MRDPDIRRRRRRDALATGVVRLGGVGVVVAVLFLAAFLIAEAAPLAKDPEVASASATTSIEPGLAGGVEEFSEAAWVLGEDGVMRLFAVEDGALIDEAVAVELADGETLAAAEVVPGGDRVAVATSAGRLALVSLSFAVDYGEELARTHRFNEVGNRWLIEEPGPELASFAVLDQGARVWGAVLRDGSVEILRGRARVNRMSGEETFDVRSAPVPDSADATHVAMLENGGLVFADHEGRLHAWRPDAAMREFSDLGSTPAGGPVRELQPLVGAGSLLVAREDGHVDRVLFRAGESGQELVLAHGLGQPVGALRDLVASPRQRVFVAVGAERLAIGQATARAVSFGDTLPAGTVRVTMSPAENHLVYFTETGLELHPLDLYHPGVTAKTLFSELQYEGLPEPDYVWQSTGGSGDYESKISFVPLIVGTLKGTLWALLPSIPLAVLGALYSARFLRGRARETVKPFVELLAGIPSVVLGFVGALWIAPAIETRMVSLVLLPIVATLMLLLVGALWARLPLATRRRLHEGHAPLVLVPLLFLLSWAVFAAGPAMEQWLFGMPVRTWAASTFDVTVEQRNAVVVGLAMGFAVTPLIFTLAEDAFRNVPKELSDASLALGATPWQTAVRVIVPPALPGVVAAVMLGLGRAVGETMIVLMATGNTPITEWNPLQGFRALSANLAVELPEAAHGGSLYRTLFLSALLLFAMTFVVNTVAEVIRARGRKEL